MKVCLLAKGSSIHTVKWAEYLQKNGNDIYVLSFVPSEIRGVKVINLNPLKLPFKIGYLSAVGKVKRILREIKPDILHAHYASSYGLIGALSGFHPFVISVWGSDVLDFPTISPVHKRVVSYSLGKAEVLTSTSKIMSVKVKELSKVKKVEVIPFGVDIKKFYHGQKSQIFTLGCTKAMEKVYGHEYLIKAFKKSLQHYPDMRLVLIGDGSLRKKLESLTAGLQLNDKVTFTGWLNQTDLALAVRTFHVLVLPSLRESFGVSALEGSASEVALIASDIPGFKETVVNNETGLFFKTRDINDLSEKILILAKDLRLRNRLSSGGRKLVVENFSWDKEAKKMLLLYGKLVSHK